MDWSSAVSTISKAAPILGSFFGPAGTGVGALLGTGIKLAASALGVEPTQDAVAEAIATDPQAALKLAQYEMDNKLEIQKLQIQSEGMAYADTADARNRQNVHEKVTGKTDYNLYILAWTIIGGFFGLTGGLLYFSYMGKPITDSTGVLFMLLGTLSTSFGMVVGYFFGSSKSSADKSDVMNETAKTLAAKI